MNYEIEGKGQGAHPDVNKNIDYYVLMNTKVDFQEDVIPYIQRENDGEAMCIFYVWGPIYARKGCFYISLHQMNSLFCEEMKGIMRAMEGKSLLKKKNISYYQMRHDL